MSKEFTFSEVAEHTSKKDLFLVIHDKVYNTSSFVDEHPGGEEVLLDVGGQDATEAFEDVGHSDEAREILDGMLVGTVKRQPGDPSPSNQPPKPAAPSTSPDGSSSVMLYIIMLIGGLGAFGAYKYMQAQSEQSSS
ncbi:cytochrome b5 [Aulographum hederae CBS 113979]|uniref:Cytochrome b5 n=1 Tax=Aulographum hederae CBS 113979 TaxID=1176131 RepID=A0A6G1GVZ7_9PEZI|nr:cytochrome b5 [Aulographum hederae CBS 113979]